MERAYCQGRGKELPIEGGMLCLSCLTDVAQPPAPRPVRRSSLDSPAVRGFMLGVTAGFCAAVMLAVALEVAASRKREQERAASDASWRRHVELSYDRGFADGQRVEAQYRESINQ